MTGGHCFELGLQVQSVVHVYNILWLSSGVIKVTKRIVVLGHRHNVYCTLCV